MPRTRANVEMSKQIKVEAVAKQARIAEAGLDGKRVGEASATTRAAQTVRDTKAAAAKTLATMGRQPVVGKAVTAVKKTTATASSAVRKAGRLARPKKERDTPMIEVRTANSVKGSAGLETHVTQMVDSKLSRFYARLTRVDVHLSDVNADKKGGDDKRCTIEARPASLKPVSVTAAAATVEKAVAATVTKMKNLLDTRFGKLARA